MKVGFFGGTFDPPHLGHMLIMSQAIHQLGLDVCFMMPTKDDTSNTNKVPVTNQEHRYAMCQEATQWSTFGLYNLYQATRHELDLPGPTITINTIRSIKETMKKENLEDEGPIEIWFLYGADSWNDMPNWEEYENILNEVRIAVIPRWGVDLKKMPDKVLEIPQMNLSSTWVREQIREGGCLEFIVDPHVLQYIRENKLYT